MTLGINKNSLKYLKMNPKNVGRNFSEHSWQRQVKTAKEILHRFFMNRFGQILADDPGLGKTWAAAICALTFSKNSLRVLILVPSERLIPKWREDVEKVKSILKITNVKIRDTWEEQAVGRITESTIAIVTHNEFRSENYPNLTADLLIVDEAHRSKGEGTQFRKNLKKRSSKFARVLFLTATPFSIGIRELTSTLCLVSRIKNETSWKALQDFDDYCSGQYQGELKLPELLKNAIEIMKPWMIRHCVDFLKKEKDEFGEIQRLKMPVPGATEMTKEILGRLDRFLNLRCMPAGLRGSDPRFSIGWKHVKDIITNQNDKHRFQEICKKNVVPALHLKWLRDNSQTMNTTHPKIDVVVKKIAKIVKERQEKIVVFCTHIITREELLSKLRCHPDFLMNSMELGQDTVWNSFFESLDAKLHPSVLKWVKKSCVRNQILGWHGLRKFQSVSEVKNILTKSVRPKVSERGRRLPSVLDYFKSFSVQAAEAEEKEERSFSLPEWRSKITTLESDKEEMADHRALFNTPFGPDVLVATNKFSESIDLHKACRILIHYELDPSPVKVKQREGRVRRIHGWAKETGLPVEIYSPFYPGTRDEQLTKIVNDRVRVFNMLLGGSRVIDFMDENWAESDNSIRFDPKLYKIIHNAFAVSI